MKRHCWDTCLPDKNTHRFTPLFREADIKYWAGARPDWLRIRNVTLAVVGGLDNELSSSGSRWRPARNWNAPPPTNTPNAQLHREQLPLKTTWKLSERLLHSRQRREGPQQSRRARPGHSHSKAINLIPGTSHNLRRTQKLALRPEEDLKPTLATPTFKTCTSEMCSQNI